MHGARGGRGRRDHLPRPATGTPRRSCFGPSQWSPPPCSPIAAAWASDRERRWRTAPPERLLKRRTVIPHWAGRDVVLIVSAAVRGRPRLVLALVARADGAGGAVVGSAGRLAAEGRAERGRADVGRRSVGSVPRVKPQSRRPTLRPRGKAARFQRQKNAPCRAWEHRGSIILASMGTCAPSGASRLLWTLRQSDAVEREAGGGDELEAAEGFGPLHHPEPEPVRAAAASAGRVPVQPWSTKAKSTASPVAAWTAPARRPPRPGRRRWRG